MDNLHHLVIGGGGEIHLPTISRHSTIDGIHLGEFTLLDILQHTRFEFGVLADSNGNDEERDSLFDGVGVVEQLGEPLLGREGHRGNAWELLDYGSIVVHVFTDEARKFYALERLWVDAEQIDISSFIMEE